MNQELKIKDLEALNILRDNHIQYTKERYRRLTNPSKIQNIINLKLAQWDILEQALKRNEPMEVDLETTISLNYYCKKTSYKCPKCGVTIIERWYNYCPHCGQKLNWEEL